MLDPLAFAVPAACAACIALLVMFLRAPGREWPGGVLAVAVAASLAVAWCWLMGAVPHFPPVDVIGWPVFLVPIATLLVVAARAWRPWLGLALLPLLATAGAWLLLTAVTPWKGMALSGQMLWAGGAGMLIALSAIVAGVVHQRGAVAPVWVALAAWAGAMAPAFLILVMAKAMSLVLAAGAIAGAVAVVSLLVRRDRAGSADETVPLVLGLGWLATLGFALADRTPPLGAVALLAGAPLALLLLLVPPLRGRVVGAVVVAVVVAAIAGAGTLWILLVQPASAPGPSY